MDLILTRTDYREDGIFSVLTDENGKEIAITLEHAYPYDNQGDFAPKLQPGQYECVRGPHRLHGMTSDFETFEITGVVGHDNILFHAGNYNADSEGCVLVGMVICETDDGSWMITHSKNTFAALMALQQGVDSFNLTVR